jgi:hypothetical protein
MVEGRINNKAPILSHMAKKPIYENSVQGCVAGRSQKPKIIAESVKKAGFHFPL